jgi:hypothetical protein
VLRPQALGAGLRSGARRSPLSFAVDARGSGRCRRRADTRVRLLCRSSTKLRQLRRQSCDVTIRLSDQAYESHSASVWWYCPEGRVVSTIWIAMVVGFFRARIRFDAEANSDRAPNPHARVGQRDLLRPRLARCALLHLLAAGESGGQGSTHDLIRSKGDPTPGHANPPRGPSAMSRLSVTGGRRLSGAHKRTCIQSSEPDPSSSGDRSRYRSRPRFLVS